jgi:hypothetical protein
MTVRTRSWAGAVATALGVVLMVVALLTAKIVNGIPSYRSGFLWAGAFLSVAGLGMILWALAGAVRQIGASEVKLEERLRAEAESLRGQKRPGSG